jgi:hypothetical protein
MEFSFSLVTPNQKCHVNTIVILNGYEAMDIWDARWFGHNQTSLKEINIQFSSINVCAFRLDVVNPGYNIYNDIFIIVSRMMSFSKNQITWLSYCQPISWNLTHHLLSIIKMEWFLHVNKLFRKTYYQNIYSKCLSSATKQTASLLKSLALILSSLTSTNINVSQI